MERVLRHALACALLLAVAVPALAAGAAPVAPQQRAKHRAAESGQAPAPAAQRPKLDSRLAAAARAQRLRGPAAALDQARGADVKVVDEKVRVVVESGRGAAGRAGAAVAAGGGRVEAEHANLVQALVPISALETLAADPSVQFVRPPLPKREAAVAGQGVAVTNAGVWQSAGLDGAGVKVAVVDMGFAGYRKRQDKGDLPSSLVTKDFCHGDLETATEHGTAVAEIVHEMAPRAQLYLICFDTEVELGQAEEYAKSRGVQIVNHSIAWFNSSRGDGSGGPGSPDAIAADAVAHGILWVNAAGNEAEQHWSGTFVDTDGNDVHEFGPGDEGNTIFLYAGEQECVTLKWDDWPASAQDYDLLLFKSSDSGNPDALPVAQSRNKQDGTQAPVEDFCYTNDTGVAQNFYVEIFKASATATPRFDLFTFNYPLEYQVAAGSIVEPASSPKALAVSAFCWQTPSTIESYSSQGPTIDGRTKPDLAAPDSVSSATYGGFAGCFSGFAGTSAAAPHVVGAAALLKQANPSFGPNELRAALLGRTIDRGPDGTDDEFGAGTLDLGMVQPTVAKPSAALAVNADSYTIRGTAAPSSLVQIWSDANGNDQKDSGETLAGSAQLDSRTKSYTIAVPLAQDAANHFVVTATDGLGHESAAAVVPTITEDSSAPPPPPILDPTAPVVVNGGAYVIQGTAEAGSLVRVWVDADADGVKDATETKLVGSQQLDGGAMSFSVKVKLPQDATRNLLVTATDPAGNESLAADVPPITEDSEQVVISRLSDSPDPFSPNGDGARDTTSISYRLSEPARVTIRIYDSAKTLVRTLLDDEIRAKGTLDETWDGKDDGSAFVPDGTYTYRVDAVDEAGNEAARVSGTVKVDRTAPAPPRITKPLSAATLDAKSYRIVGTAERGSLVRVWDDANHNGHKDGGEQLVRSVQLGKRTKSYAITVPLAKGSANYFVVTATDLAGNESSVAVVPTLTDT